MERVIAYVDGFNLYFGLRSKGWQRYYWLNIREIVRRLLRPGQVLAYVKYFTARVSGPPEKRDRQNEFIEALSTLPDLSIYYGKYQINSQKCRSCGVIAQIPNEKMTDVNIAVEMLVDAHQNLFDTALLVSADSDLTGPVRAIRALFPEKRVVLAFPPDRSSWELQQVAHAYFTIGQFQFRKSQFPDEVRKPDGYVLRRPATWR